MRRSTTLFLALLLVGVGLYYAIWEKRPGEAGGTGLSAAKILALAEGDSVNWLQIQNRLARETLSLRLEESEEKDSKSTRAWRLEYPVNYPAEDFLVQGMVMALTLSPRLREFPFEEKKAREFGLQSPPMKIGIETEKGRGRRYLLVGKEAPTGSGVYARWEDEKKSFLMPLTVKGSLERSAYSLRKKKIFRIVWDEIDWIHGKWGAREFRIEKEGEKWQGVLPKPLGEIPLEKASDLIYAFGLLYVKEFLDGKNPERKEFRLKGKERSGASSFVAVGKGEETRERLLLGAPVREKGVRYGLREKEGIVLLISEANVESLRNKFEELYQETERDSRAAEGSSGKDSGLRAEKREESR